jgi:hypothetical protein
VSYDETYLAVTMLLETLPLCSALTPAQSEKEAAHTIVTTLANSPFAPYILGANEYGGVRWFNKERTELALSMALVTPVVLSKKPPEFAGLNKLWAKLSTAERKSGYKLDALIGMLEWRRRKKRGK